MLEAIVLSFLIACFGGVANPSDAQTTQADAPSSDDQSQLEARLLVRLKELYGEAAPGRITWFVPSGDPGYEPRPLGFGKGSVEIRTMEFGESPKLIPVSYAKKGYVAVGVIVQIEQDTKTKRAQLILDTDPCNGVLTTFVGTYASEVTGKVRCGDKQFERVVVEQK
jgi:hypothetical protein